MNEEQLKEIAILAKELGFKPRTLSTGVTFEKFTRVDKGLLVNDTCYYLLLCEIQLWLLKKFNIYILLDIALKIEKWFYVLSNSKDMIVLDIESLYYDTYEESLAIGILEGLKLIKNGN